MAALGADLEHENHVVFILRPGRNQRRIAAVVLEQIFGKFIEQTVFPGNKYRGVLVFVFLQLALQTFDLTKTELCVDRQAAACGGRLDG